MRDFVSSVPAIRAELSRNGRIRYEGLPKRTLDILFVLMAAPFVVPLVAVFWLIIRLDGGPGFYVQQRVGRRGIVFRFLKLRTMVVDSDAALERHCAANPAAAAEWARMQKLRDDPRITRFGRFLRSTSLDELPQLWNVFVGDMSLVGPRPFMVEQEAEYQDAGGGAYYDLRPGITGLWQVSARNDATFRDRVKFDTGYRDTLSLKTDVKIILQTFPVVLKANGH